MGYDYVGDFEDPDLQEEFEINWESVLLHWISQIESMEPVDEVEDLEELI